MFKAAEENIMLGNVSERDDKVIENEEIHKRTNR